MLRWLRGTAAAAGASAALLGALVVAPSGAGEADAATLAAP